MSGTANTYAGTTDVKAGTLLVNGALTADTSLVTVHRGATLGGAGVIGTTAGARDVVVQDGGVLSPGDAHPVSGLSLPGRLTVYGEVDLQAGAVFLVQLGGLSAGVDYDQLKVHGLVDLTGDLTGAGGAELQLRDGFALPFGAALRIIANDATDRIDTRFQDRPDGEFIYWNDSRLNLSYHAGEQANDVVLTRPDRFDFDGFHAYAATHYDGVSPFRQKSANNDFGWQSLPPQYFERNWPEAPPYGSDTSKLRYDGQATDNMGSPLTFAVDVVAGQAYEVMILTGDSGWNHDRQQFTVSGTGLTPSSQVVDTWGGGGADYRWVRFTTGTVADAGHGLGTLLVTLQDLGGADAAAVILGMDIRPVDTVGQITLTRTSPLDNTWPLSDLPADGFTVDTYQGTGAPPNATITVTVSAGSPVQYATVTPDGDVTMFGTQMTADATGLFTFSVLRPSTLTTNAASEDWTITAEEVSGLSRGTVAQPYTVPDNAQPLRFDFGVYGSPVQTGFLQVVPQTIYSAMRGYGWTSRVAGVDRKDNVNAGTSSNLRRDLNYAKDATFKVDLPDGTYSVQIYHSNPMHNGTVPYLADQIQVIAEPLQGGQVVQPTIASIAAGTTTIQTLTVNVSGGALELQFKDLGGQDGNFVVSGIDISVGSGTWPAAAPLLAAGDPRDDGAAAIHGDVLQGVVAEAAARWTASGLTAQQAATLSTVQFAVADLGGAYLGLANPATNQVRIDDDAARMGWRMKDEGRGMRDEPPEPRTLNAGLDLLTVVLHEIGHLLGYEHRADGLMAPVLEAGRSGAEAIEPLWHVQWQTSPSSFILHPSSLIADLASPRDSAFADLGRDVSDEPDLVSPESRDSEILAGAAVRSGGEATRAKVPRPTGLQRYQRELDECFAELAAADQESP